MAATKPGGGESVNFQTDANITNSGNDCTYKFATYFGKMLCWPPISAVRVNLDDHPYRQTIVHRAFLQLLRSIEIVAFPQNY